METAAQTPVGDCKQRVECGECEADEQTYETGSVGKIKRSEKEASVQSVPFHPDCRGHIPNFYQNAI